MKHQKPDGDLSAGGSTMYTHGLAAITLCEAYGLTKDKQIGTAAQAASSSSRTRRTRKTAAGAISPADSRRHLGGGWQIMARKKRADGRPGRRLQDFGRCQEVLEVGFHQGKNGGGFSYMPGTAPNNSMTSVGLLCSQYMGPKRERSGHDRRDGHLMRTQPNVNQRNSTTGITPRRPCTICRDPNGTPGTGRCAAR